MDNTDVNLQHVQIISYEYNKSLFLNGLVTI